MSYGISRREIDALRYPVPADLDQPRELPQSRVTSRRHQRWVSKKPFREHIGDLLRALLSSVVAYCLLLTDDAGEVGARGHRVGADQEPSSGLCVKDERLIGDLDAIAVQFREVDAQMFTVGRDSTMIAGGLGRTSLAARSLGMNANGIP